MESSFVCAMSKETGHTALSRTNPSRRSSHLFNAARIWEAARATSAASSFFDSIKIGRFGEEFVDGATGFDNPVQYLWNEANLSGLTSLFRKQHPLARVYRDGRALSDAF